MSAVPGRRSAGGALAGLIGGLAVLLRAQARRADRVVRPKVTAAPVVETRYGAPGAPPLTMAVLGDSSAAGVGAEHGAQTLGGLLAAAVAARGRCVTLELAAVTGARSADLAGQVAQVLPRRPDLVVISVGANDVRHRRSPRRAARELAAAVRELRAQGAFIVVGTCPDLGTLEPVPQPLRLLAGGLSAVLERAQARAVERAGDRSRDRAGDGPGDRPGESVPVPDPVAVRLGSRLGPTFAADPTMFAPDGFHPSPLGYAAVAALLLEPIDAWLGPQVIPAPTRPDGNPLTLDP